MNSIIFGVMTIIQDSQQKDDSIISPTTQLWWANLRASRADLTCGPVWARTVSHMKDSLYGHIPIRTVQFLHNFVVEHIIIICVDIVSTVTLACFLYLHWLRYSQRQKNDHEDVMKKKKLMLLFKFV